MIVDKRTNQRAGLGLVIEHVRPRCAQAKYFYSSCNLKSDTYDGGYMGTHQLIADLVKAPGTTFVRNAGCDEAWAVIAPYASSSPSCPSNHVVFGRMFLTRASYDALCH